VKLIHRIAGASLAGLAAAAAHGAETPAGPGAPFAAATTPGAGGAPGIGSLAQVSLALALVLALVFALAWMLRRMRDTRRAGAPGIEVLAELALGQKERAVLVQVDRARLLLGVAAGQVRTLHVLPEADPLEPQGSTPAATPSFAELLRRSLGR